MSSINLRKPASKNRRRSVRLERMHATNAVVWPNEEARKGASAGISWGRKNGRAIALSLWEMTFDDAPPLVIWEISRACDLACSNCRSSAAPRRHSSELSTEEGIRLLEQIRTFGHPLMVLTGGDPLKRPDLFTLLRKSVELGLRTDVKACATPLLTRRAIEQFKEAGVDRVAIGLDGWDAASHDEFRGIPGSFDCAMSALETAREIGLDTQVQTTVTAVNRYRLDEVAGVVEQVNARAWSLALAGDEFQKVFEDIYEISRWSSFDIKTGGSSLPPLPDANGRKS